MVHSNSQASSESRGIVTVDPSVSINMDKIKSELQRKLSGGSLIQGQGQGSMRLKEEMGDATPQQPIETPETINIEKVKEELQQKFNPSLYRINQGKESSCGGGSTQNGAHMPDIDQSNYVKPNSQTQTHAHGHRLSDDHYEIDMDKIKSELQQKLAPSSVKKSSTATTTATAAAAATAPVVTDLPVLAGTVEIEKYKIKPELQKATASSSKYRSSDGQFDLIKVKAELQQRFTPGGSTSARSRSSSSAYSSPRKLTKSDIKHISTGSLDSPCMTEAGVDSEGIDAIEGADQEIDRITSYRSPVVSRRQFSFEFLRQLRESDVDNGSDITPDGAVFGEYRTPSPQVGRVHSYAGPRHGANAGTATPSPKGSPLVARHSSFSKLAERVPSPLRSLFGGVGGDRERERTSSESDAYSSAPPSPRRIPSMTTNASPLTKASYHRSLSNGNAQVNSPADNFRFVCMDG